MPAQETDKTSPLTTEKPVHFEVLLEWEAPVRLFKRRSKEYFSTIGAIVLLLIIILLFMKEWLLIAIVISLFFVSYVMATIPPENTTHKITSKGVVTGEKFYAWENLGRFWFIHKWDKAVLNIEVKENRFPKRLILLVDEDKFKKIDQLVRKYLPFEEPEKAWMEKAGDWLSKKIPLEIEK